MQNRVTPQGQIVPIDLRGAWMGNRGHLHDGTRIVRPYRSIGWVICALEHNGWRLQQWHPTYATVLFFHDEAVALAAGHRPCGLCRRASLNEFRSALAVGLGVSVPSAAALDRRLHDERVDARTRQQKVHEARWPDVPDGAFVLVGGQPALTWADALVPWTADGYEAARERPRRGHVTVLTPPATVAALRGGYLPQVDPVAGST
jgi:hypothetical protein